MKRITIITFALLFFVLGSMAQKKTLQATRYKEFRPSIVTFVDGHQSHQSLTNIFIKNASLLFLRGEYTMEADMDNIVAVDFTGDKRFVVINRQLAYPIDSINGNVLYCIELFDQEAYQQNLRNNINISNLDLSNNQMSTSTIDINTEDDYKLPIFRHYWIKLNGEYVKVHERDLKLKLSKEQRTMMKRIIALPDFSWQNEESLKMLLKVISK